MATSHYFAGDSYTSVKDSMNDGGTLTLIGANSGKITQIKSIAIKATAAVAITAVDVLITKADGTTVIAEWGAASALPVGGKVFAFTSPINCAPGDNPIITLTLTGADNSSVAMTVNYTFTSK